LALTPRVAADARVLGLADHVAPAALNESVGALRTLADALLTGSEQLRVTSLPEGDARRAVATIRQLAAAQVAALGRLLPGMAGLAQARTAEARIAADSESVRERLETLRN